MWAASKSDLTVIYRPTNVKYQVHVDKNTTVRDVILDVNRQANFDLAKNCSLWCKSERLCNHDRISQTSIYPISPRTTDFPEVRLNFFHQLPESYYSGQRIIIPLNEQTNSGELLDVSSQCFLEHTESFILRSISEKMSYHTLSTKVKLTSVPLPAFSKQSIDYLPTIYIVITGVSIELQWKRFLKCVADDLDIEQKDMVTVDIVDSPLILKIKLSTKILQNEQQLRNVNEKLTSNALPSARNFIKEHGVSSNPEMEIELENFNMELDTIQNNVIITPNYIDLALRLSERVDVINLPMYDFLTKKSRQITNCLLNSFKQYSTEYIIDHIEIIYHEKHLYSTLTNDKILFHATHITNFENIFENFLFLSKRNLVENGKYGRGYYFSSSPRQATRRVKFIPRSSIYLLCATVKLGNTLKTANSSFENKNMQKGYDSHYIPIGVGGKPKSPGKKLIADEYVIKRDNQILPLYIIGLRPIQRFLILRDETVINGIKTEMFKKLEQRYDFNLYGCHSNKKVFDILDNKLTDPPTKCVIITNGDDTGEQFVRRCRELRPGIPVVVYCTNLAYHKQWAASLGQPKIKVSNNVKKIITFVDHRFAGP